MTRQDGITLVERYDDACADEYIASFCDYIGITAKEFWAQVHSAVNPRLFRFTDGGRIERRFKVGEGLPAEAV